MDLDEANEIVNKTDTFLTSLGFLLKKHWRLLILLSFLYSVYWVFSE